MQEQRDRQRLDLARLAFAKRGEYARGGLLKNISASGAILEFSYPTGKAEHSFALGNYVEIEIEDFDALKGTVIRVGEIEIAVQFDLQDMDEQDLIIRIMSAANRIPMTDGHKNTSA